MLKNKKDLKNIFVDVKLQLNDVIFLEKEVQNRLKRVMRFKKGWQFAVFNGVDGLFLAQVQDADCQEILLIEKLKDQPEKTTSVLFLPILKKEALSNAVRQATELGIDIIQPIMTEYTVEKDFKFDRYNQIAVGAAEQSERLTLVDIKEMLNLQYAVKNFNNQIFWACERLDKVPAGKITFSQDDGVLIGPEGGFSDSEKEFLFDQENIVPQSLGKSILKADTAVVTSIFKFKMLT
ncbi:MAG TPA: hypothetical protein DCL21_01395 [Alphaproteobacteria bacterium]|nr:hypothetical protein [Alphaproteobacteria bacterium]